MYLYGLICRQFASSLSITVFEWELIGTTRNYKCINLLNKCYFYECIWGYMLLLVIEEKAVKWRQ